MTFSRYFLQLRTTRNRLNSKQDAMRVDLINRAEAGQLNGRSELDVKS